MECPLHRIKQVRLSERVSLRSMARRMKVEVAVVQQQEDAYADLRLSELYRWQQALKVPACELLLEPSEPLSAPVKHRACLLRLARTAHCLLAESPTPRLTQLAQTMIDQLCELMPEIRLIKLWETAESLSAPEELRGPTKHTVDLADAKSEPPTAPD